MDFRIIHSDCIDAMRELIAGGVQVDLIMTSPPYADARKKQYGGVNPDYYAEWFSTFHEGFWNILKPTGSFVINIKDKVVNGIRHRYVWETIQKLTSLGWHCIDDYIWVKKNPMPGYWPTRLRDGWEYCFHLSKTKTPYINQDAVRQPTKESTKKRINYLSEKYKYRYASENQSGFGNNLSHYINKEKVLPSNVLTISSISKSKKHPAAYPIDLPRFFIKLLSPPGGLILDPFAGSGTTGQAAIEEGFKPILIEREQEYIKDIEERLNGNQGIGTKVSTTNVP
jgi:site-specific DNA-methyltransferase (adenine-specific)